MKDVWINAEEYLALETIRNGGVEPLVGAGLGKAVPLSESLKRAAETCDDTVSAMGARIVDLEVEVDTLTEKLQIREKYIKALERLAGLDGC